MNLVKTESFRLAVNAVGDSNSKKLALVLPGRLDTKDYSCFNSHLKYLSNKGFYAVSLDPPGTWESPGGIELFTTSNYMKSVNELIEYFGNRETLLIGHSRGGAVAIYIGTNNPLVMGIVTIMASFGAPTPPGPEDLGAGFYIDYRDLPPGERKTSQQKRFEVPMSYFKDGGKYDDAKLIETCVKPKLIFYGVDDAFITPKRVKKVFNSAPEPKVLHELKCNHDYRYYPGIVDEVNQEVGAFVEKYLP